MNFNLSEFFFGSPAWDIIDLLGEIFPLIDLLCATYERGDLKAVYEDPPF